MIMPMKIILVGLLFLVLVGFKSSIGTRLLEYGLFISPENPPAFDSKRSAKGGSDPFKDPKEKIRKPCGEPCTLAFRFEENGMVDDKMKEAPNSEEVGLNVLVKGSVTQCGGTERGNNGIRREQRLAKSYPSPGVGDFQIFPESPQESGATHIQDQQRVSNKRILKSSPSPGGGH